MKRILPLLLFALMCMPLSAQHFDPEHRHAIEVSSGFPPIHTFLLSGGNSYHLMNAGIRDIDHLRIGINISCSTWLNGTIHASITLNLMLYKSRMTGRGTILKPNQKLSKAAWIFGRHIWLISGGSGTAAIQYDFIHPSVLAIFQCAGLSSPILHP